MKLFNGLPVYYGGDRYDSDDTEEFIPNAPNEMEYMTCTERRLDGEDNRSVNTVMSGPMCATVSKGARGEVDEPSDTPGIMFRGKYLAQLRALLPLKTADGSSGTACPPGASTTSRTDGVDATPRPPRRRRRQRGQFRDTPDQIAPRLTEQDPLMAAGAVVFNCRPALLPVSVDLSGIDMRASRSAISSAESVLVPPERQFGGGGGFV